MLESITVMGTYSVYSSLTLILLKSTFLILTACCFVSQDSKCTFPGWFRTAIVAVSKQLHGRKSLIIIAGKWIRNHHSAVSECRDGKSFSEQDVWQRRMGWVVPVVTPCMSAWEAQCTAGVALGF